MFLAVAVEGCSNGIFGYVRSYGKSPCFLRCAFLSVVDVDRGGFVLPSINIHDLL